LTSWWAGLRPEDLSEFGFGTGEADMEPFDFAEPALAFGYADTCRRTVFAWLTRYNTRRWHSANGHLSPNEYEHPHHTAKLTLAA
jgi:transposase InsO family protein